MRNVNPQQFSRQMSAAEVEGLAPEQTYEVRKAGASYQRGKPESAMLRLQEHHGGGVYPYAAEHVGDLTHRMNESMTDGITMETTVPKVRSQHANLHSAYGFEREHGEQTLESAEFKGQDPAAFAEKSQGLGRAYAEEHRKVPVYNYPSEVARDAAVSLGEGRFDDTRQHLDTLNSMQMGGKGWAKGDMEGLLALHRSDPTKHKSAMVDYLRGKESRTPAITDAATVMLGGKKR